jgi:oxalate decarboxylase
MFFRRYFGYVFEDYRMKKRKPDVSRRKFLEVGSAALAMGGMLGVAAAQETRSPREQSQERHVPHSPDHHLPNETEPPPSADNSVLEQQNPDSTWAPDTDNGTLAAFKYPFAFSRKRQESGGWTRQVSVRELPISKDIAGVEMRLTAGGVREMHWHVEAEWAIMLYGNARITAVNNEGKSFVNDVSEGDLWLFPKGVPHSIQGLGPDGCRFLLVFDDGNFNEFETFLLTDWLAHTPSEVLSKNFAVPASTFANVPKKELFIFQSELPSPLTVEQQEAAAETGAIDQVFVFRPSTMKPNKITRGGEVKIIDSKNFPVTPIAGAIVTLHPGGLRELHWHPNADEWQYYVKGKGRMGVFGAGARSRTMDFEEGDVGYIEQSLPHYIENTGNSDLVFLEMFKSDHYEDISLTQWLAHTPHKIVDEHIGVGAAMLESIPKEKIVIDPR